MYTTKSLFSSVRRDFTRYIILAQFLIFGAGTLHAQPAGFKKGVYLNLTTESSFVMYNNVSVNTMDCINMACSTSYIDGVTFKILWKDLKVDSSSGKLSLTIYKQEISQLMKAVIGYHKAVGLALYAGSFTPPAILNAMPAFHVLKNMRLASQSGGPCLTDTLVTNNLVTGTFNIPAAWDNVYQTNFRNIMRIISNYLIQNNITLSYIVFTGINEYSAETRMPNDICQTRNANGGINFFQNDYVMWKNAGFNGYNVSPSTNQARSTFDLFLNKIYDSYAAYKNTVLCVQSMGATAEFPDVPADTSEYKFNDPRSVNYFSCISAYDTASDVFVNMLADAMNARQGKRSFATMYCSMNEIYGSGLDYVGIINGKKGNNTELCKSLKAYHLRDVEFIRGPVAPSQVGQEFTDDFSQAVHNCAQYGAQFIEVFPYDVYAAEQESNPGLKTEFQNAFNYVHTQLTTASPDYNGYPASTSISMTSSLDSSAFSIPALPVVNNYTWQLDGITLLSGATLNRLPIPKLLLALGSHLVTVKYSSNCGTRTATWNYKGTTVLSQPNNDPLLTNGFYIRQESQRTFVISFNAPVQNARIFVFDMAGRKLQEFAASGSEANLIMQTASAGLYIIKVVASETGITGASKISIE